MQLLTKASAGSGTIRRSASVAAVVVAGIALSACMSSGDTVASGDVAASPTTTTSSSGGGLASKIFGAPNPNTQGKVIEVSPETFPVASAAICPPLEIRGGTEAMVVYGKGQKVDPLTGETPPVQFQASITRSARECRQTPGGVAIKVGVAGRVVGGPAAKAGTVTLPVRIAAVQGGKTVSSKLYRINVSLMEPDFSADFTQLDESLVLPVAPGNSDFVIYLGFDEGPKKS